MCKEVVFDIYPETLRVDTEDYLFFQLPKTIDSYYIVFQQMYIKHNKPTLYIYVVNYLNYNDLPPCSTIA